MYFKIEIDLQQMHSKVSKSIKKYQKVSKSIKKYQKVSKSIIKCCRGQDFKANTGCINIVTSDMSISNFIL
jgi:hypothetical protein